MSLMDNDGKPSQMTYLVALVDSQILLEAPLEPFFWTIGPLDRSLLASVTMAAHFPMATHRATPLTSSSIEQPTNVPPQYVIGTNGTNSTFSSLRYMGQARRQAVPALACQ